MATKITITSGLWKPDPTWEYDLTNKQLFVKKRIDEYNKILESYYNHVVEYNQLDEQRKGVVRPIGTIKFTYSNTHNTDELMEYTTSRNINSLNYIVSWLAERTFWYLHCTYTYKDAIVAANTKGVSTSKRELAKLPKYFAGAVDPNPTIWPDDMVEDKDVVFITFSKNIVKFYDWKGKLFPKLPHLVNTIIVGANVFPLLSVLGYDETKDYSLLNVRDVCIMPAYIGKNSPSGTRFASLEDVVKTERISTYEYGCNKYVSSLLQNEVFDGNKFQYIIQNDYTINHHFIQLVSLFRLWNGIRGGCRAKAKAWYQPLPLKGIRNNQPFILQLRHLLSPC